jgi:hypothetical protein
MKKIKILNWSLIIFITLGVFAIVAAFAQLLFYRETFEVLYLKSTFGISTFYIMNALTLLLLFGLYQVQQSFSFFIKNSFFNSQSAKLLKKGGFLLILNGFLSVFNNLFSLNIATETLISNYMMYAMIILIGIGLMAVSDIIFKGEIIEQENLLTI